MPSASRDERTAIPPDANPRPLDRGETVAHVRFIDQSRLDRFYARQIKPIFDRVVAALLIVVLVPVVVAVAIAVRLNLGSPVLYRQPRVGLRGKPLSFVKFRSMLPDRRIEPATGEYGGPERRITHKTETDPRHTAFGRFIRKTSLDELPQLLLVLKGEMSLVGPRPELASVVADKFEPWQHQRHSVKPGVTGLWQVSTRQQGRLLLEDIEDDLVYVENMSFLTDLRILFATPFAALGLQKVPFVPTFAGEQRLPRH